MSDDKTRAWKVGDEVARLDGRGIWDIVRVEAITPSGLLRVGQGVLLYPNLRRRGGELWDACSYDAVTDEIRSTMRRQMLVRKLGLASWHTLPTSTLEAVVETLARCKASAESSVSSPATPHDADQWRNEAIHSTME